MKNLLSLALALAMCLTIPVSAAEESPISPEEGAENIALSAQLGELSLEDIKVNRPWTMQYRENEEEDWIQEERTTYGAVRQTTEFTVRHTGASDDGTTLSVCAACYLGDGEGAYTWANWPHSVLLTKSGTFISDDADPAPYGGLVELRAGESVTFTLPFDWYARKGRDVIVQLRAVMDFPQYDWTYWKQADFKVDESAYIAASIQGPSHTPPKPVTFSDVKATDWYQPYVEKAVAAGLMGGTTDSTFSPGSDLDLSQVLVLAYQLHSQANGGSLPQTGGAWYMPYYQYCLDSGIIAPEQLDPSGLTRKATRFDLVAILDRAVPESSTAPVKEAVTVPDLAESDPYGPAVYKWYRAGIVSGDETGRFNGSSNISRAEVTVILCQLSNL